MKIELDVRDFDPVQSAAPATPAEFDESAPASPQPFPSHWLPREELTEGDGIAPCRSPGKDCARGHSECFRTVNFVLVRNRDRDAAISGAGSRNSPGEPHHRAICSRRILAIRGSTGESEVMVKAELRGGHGESELRITTQSGIVRGGVRLAKLLRGVEMRTATMHGDLEVFEIAYDSRLVNTGTLFVAIRGEKTDGNRYVTDVVARGAVAVISEQANPGTIPAEFPWIQVANARKALAI